MTNRDILLFMAQIENRIDLYEEAIANIKQIIAQDPNLSIEERELLVACYKGLERKYFTSWSLIKNNFFLSQESDPDRYKKVEEYSQRIANEFYSLCYDLISLIDITLLPVANDPYSILYYEKTKGDFYFYLARLMDGNDRKIKSNAASECYKRAIEIGEEQIKEHISNINNRLYLSLVLNYSVFLYEIEGARTEAINFTEEIIKRANDYFKSEHFDDCCNPTCDSSALNMMRDNLCIWIQEKEKENINDFFQKLIEK